MVELRVSTSSRDRLVSPPPSVCSGSSGLACAESRRAWTFVIFWIVTLRP